MTTPDTRMVSGVVWDFGNVLIDWQPARAVAAGVGEAEAQRFLAEFDFHSWNHVCDAGGSWDHALEWLEQEAPEWTPHGRAYLENFTLSLAGPVPGTHALLRELHAAGVPQIGLTNWSRELYPHAPAAYDVIGLLDDVVVSGVEGVAKPEPKIFQIAIDRAGLPAKRLAFIDDNPRNVEAAIAIGMHGILFSEAASLRTELRALGLPA